jgi:hypothetical protein
MAKPQKFDAKKFLTDSEKEQAIQEYMLNNPKVVEESLRAYINQFVGNTFHRVVYDGSGKAEKLYGAFRDDLVERTASLTQKVINDKEFMDDLMDETKGLSMIKKVIKAKLQDEYTYRWRISEYIDNFMPTLIKTLMESDDTLKDFSNKVREELIKRVSATSVEKEVERLMKGRY